MTPNEIIIHCSATPADMHSGWTAQQWREEINRWHKAKSWKMIGYHFVIARDGSSAPGRPMSMQGAHVKGHNKNTLGICLIGPGSPIAEFEDSFTQAQLDSLVALIAKIEVEHGRMKLSGHNDYTDAKTCPGFKVGPLEATLRGMVRTAPLINGGTQGGWLALLLKLFKGWKK